MCITYVQRRPNVCDVGPALYKRYTNVLCLLGKDILFWPSRELVLQIWHQWFLTSSAAVASFPLPYAYFYVEIFMFAG